MRLIILNLVLLAIALPSFAQGFEIAPRTVTEWKMVFGQIETRDRVPARARIGGTVVELFVTEGDEVAAGEAVARVEDTKLNFQVDALDAQLDALRSRLRTAQSDLERGEALMERGVITSQRLEELQTGVSVLNGEIAGVEAERFIVEQQIDEGVVLAPEAGIVLSVPISLGSVVAPGEGVAIVGGGGVFLRLAVPERHAEDLTEGDRIEIGSDEEVREGTLAKLYPQIEGGRVQADVEVEGLDASFIGLRVPVRLPVGERDAILVPDGAVKRKGGLDFVSVETEAGPAARAVVPGAVLMLDGERWREILSGVGVGDVVADSDE